MKLNRSLGISWFMNGIKNNYDLGGDKKVKSPASGLSTIFQSFARKAGTFPPGWTGRAISITGNIFNSFLLNINSV